MIGESELRAEAKKIAAKFDVKGVVLIVLNENECEYSHYWPQCSSPCGIEEIIAEVGKAIADDQETINN